MKKLFTIILLILPGLAFAAVDSLSVPKMPIDSVTNQVAYKSIIQAPALSSKIIYDRSREWFANNFKSANNVLQMDDKDAGKLIGKGSTHFTYQLASGKTKIPMTYRVSYVINVTIKEGKYRVTMTDIMVSIGGAPEAGIENAYSSSINHQKSSNEHMEAVFDMMKQMLFDVNDHCLQTINSINQSINTAKKDDF